jgi:NADH:ubiquinone oxidoreductase subunit 6 (subunit J)
MLFSAKGWSLPFEIASLILTAALLGAVWWTKEGEE